MKVVKTQTQDMIDQTIAFWSQRTEQQFSHEDARQAVDNVCGFFSVLAEWQRCTSEEDDRDI